MLRLSEPQPKNEKGMGGGEGKYPRAFHLSDSSMCTFSTLHLLFLHFSCVPGPWANALLSPATHAMISRCPIPHCSSCFQLWFSTASSRGSPPSGRKGRIPGFKGQPRG